MPSGKIVASLIGAGAALAAAGILAAATLASKPETVSPPSQYAAPAPSVTSQDESSSPEPDSSPAENNDGQSGSTAGDTWVADLEPIVQTGLWYSGSAVVRGQTYLHCLQTSQTGVQGQTVWAQYALDGRYTDLTGLLGIVDGGHSSEKAVFEIVVDDVVVEQVEVAIGEQLAEFDVSLAGAQDLILRVTNVSQSAYWANPVFAELKLK
jgi:hypothetical protein